MRMFGGGIGLKIWNDVTWMPSDLVPTLEAGDPASVSFLELLSWSHVLVRTTTLRCPGQLADTNDWGLGNGKINLNEMTKLGNTHAKP